MKKLLMFAAPVALVASVAAFANPTETVDARQAYFKSLNDVMKPMGALAKSFDTEAAKAEAAKLEVLLATDIAPLFAPGTSDADMPGKSRSKAAIWQNMEDFGAKGAAFHQAGNALVAAANNADSKAFTTAFGQMGGSCKACHDSYRVPR